MSKKSFWYGTIGRMLVTTKDAFIGLFVGEEPTYDVDGQNGINDLSKREDAVNVATAAAGGILTYAGASCVYLKYFASHATLKAAGITASQLTPAFGVTAIVVTLMGIYIMAVALRRMNAKANPNPKRAIKAELASEAKLDVIDEVGKKSHKEHEAKKGSPATA